MFSFKKKPIKFLFCYKKLIAKLVFAKRNALLIMERKLMLIIFLNEKLNFYL